MRPYFVCFNECEDVVIEKRTLINSPVWTVHSLLCERVIIRDLTIRNPYDSPNTDGIAPDYSADVRIENCTIDVGDDCIAVKCGTRERTIVRLMRRLQSQQAFRVVREDQLLFLIFDERIQQHAAHIHGGVAGGVVRAEDEFLRAEQVDGVAQHAAAENAVAGQVEIVVAALFHALHVPHKGAVLARMRRNEHGVRVLFHHAVYAVLVHAVETDEHVVLLRAVQNDVQIFAVIGIPVVSVRAQFADHPDAQLLHALDLFAGVLYEIRVDVEARHIEIAVHVAEGQRVIVGLFDLRPGSNDLLSEFEQNRAADLRDADAQHVPFRLLRAHLKAFPVAADVLVGIEKRVRMKIDDFKIHVDASFQNPYSVIIIQPAGVNQAVSDNMGNRR